jgi:hypothetical protein
MDDNGQVIRVDKNGCIHDSQSCISKQLIVILKTNPKTDLPY